jgi:hypothetical protein
VVKVKMSPLILVRVPLVRWRRGAVGGVVGVGLGVGVGTRLGVGVGVGVGVAAGAQAATTVSNMITSKVTAHVNRCFIDVPPNYYSFYFPREDYLLSFGFSHRTDDGYLGHSQNPFIVRSGNHKNLLNIVYGYYLSIVKFGWFLRRIQGCSFR